MSDGLRSMSNEGPDRAVSNKLMALLSLAVQDCQALDYGSSATIVLLNKWIVV